MLDLKYALKESGNDHYSGVVDQAAKVGLGQGKMIGLILKYGLPAVMELLKELLAGLGNPPINVTNPNPVPPVTHTTY